MPSLNRILRDRVSLFILWHEYWYYLHQHNYIEPKWTLERAWWRPETVAKKKQPVTGNLYDDDIPF